MKYKKGNILVFKYYNRNERMYIEVTGFRSSSTFLAKVLRDEDSKDGVWKINSIHVWENDNHGLLKVVYKTLKNAVIMESL